MKRKEKDLTVQQEKIEREQYNEGKEWEKIKNEGDGERLENESQVGREVQGLSKEIGEKLHCNS